MTRVHCGIRGKHLGKNTVRFCLKTNTYEFQIKDYNVNNQTIKGLKENMVNILYTLGPQRSKKQNKAKQNKKSDSKGKNSKKNQNTQF